MENLYCSQSRQHGTHIKENDFNMYNSSDDYDKQHQNVSKNYFPTSRRISSSKTFFDKCHYVTNRRTSSPSTQPSNSNRENLKHRNEKSYSKRQDLDVRSHKQVKFTKHFPKHDEVENRESNVFYESVHNTHHNSKVEEWTHAYEDGSRYNEKVGKHQKQDISCGPSAQWDGFSVTRRDHGGVEYDKTSEKNHQKSEECHKYQYGKNSGPRSNLYVGKFDHRYGGKSSFINVSKYNSRDMYKQEVCYKGVDKMLSEEAVQETDGFSEGELSKYSANNNVGTNTVCTYVNSVEGGSDGRYEKDGWCNTKGMDVGKVQDGTGVRGSLYENSCTPASREIQRQEKDYSSFIQENLSRRNDNVDHMSAVECTLKYPINGHEDECTRNDQGFRGINESEIVNNQLFSRSADVVLQDNSSENYSFKSSYEYSFGDGISKQRDLGAKSDKYFIDYSPADYEKSVADEGYSKYEGGKNEYENSDNGYDKQVVGQSVPVSNSDLNQMVLAVGPSCSKTYSYVASSDGQIKNISRKMEPIGNPRVNFIIKPFANQLIVPTNNNSNLTSPIVQPFPKSVNIIHRPAVVRSLYQVINPPPNALIKPLPNPILKPIIRPVQVMPPIRVVRPLRFVAPRVVPMPRPSMPFIVRYNALPASVVRHQVSIPCIRRPVYLSNQPQPQTIIPANVEPRHVFFSSPNSVYLGKENNNASASGILKSVKQLDDNLIPDAIVYQELQQDRKLLFQNTCTYVNETEKDKKFQINPKKQWFDYDCHMLHKKRLRLVSRLRKARHQQNEKEVLELKDAIKRFNREYTTLIRERKTKYISDLETKGEIELICELTITSLVERVMKVRKSEMMAKVTTKDNVSLGREGTEGKDSVESASVYDDHKPCNDDDDDDDDDDDCDVLEVEEADAYGCVQSVEEEKVSGLGNAQISKGMKIMKDVSTEVVEEGKKGETHLSCAGKTNEFEENNQGSNQLDDMDGRVEKDLYHVQDVTNSESDTKRRQRYIA